MEGRVGRFLGFFLLRLNVFFLFRFVGFFLGRKFGLDLLLFFIYDFFRGLLFIRIWFLGLKEDWGFIGFLFLDRFFFLGSLFLFKLFLLFVFLWILLFVLVFEFRCRFFLGTILKSEFLFRVLFFFRCLRGFGGICFVRGLLFLYWG